MIQKIVKELKFQLQKCRKKCDKFYQKVKKLPKVTSKMILTTIRSMKMVKNPNTYGLDVLTQESFLKKS